MDEFLYHPKEPSSLLILQSFFFQNGRMGVSHGTLFSVKTFTQPMIRFTPLF